MGECECKQLRKADVLQNSVTLSESRDTVLIENNVKTLHPICNSSSINAECGSSTCDRCTPGNDTGKLIAATEEAIKCKPVSMNSIDIDMCQEEKELPVMNRMSPEDKLEVVRDMRRTLGPCFATAGLVMAAKTQVDMWNTQIGVTDTEISDQPEDSDRQDSYFFKEVYTPFMEILIKGNSGVSKINDHAKTVSRSEQCFFCLLILVMFIYGIGILTAIVLLSSIMWYS